MTSARVFVSRRLPDDILKPLFDLAEVEIWPHDDPPSQAVLMEKMPELNGLLSLLTDPLNAVVLDKSGPNFKVISQMAVGFDNIDIAAATRKGICVGHTPGVLTETCADFTFALLLAAARRVVEGDRIVRQGNWPIWGPFVLTGPEVNNATLGIVGFGRIGQAVARRARGFGMKILYYDQVRYPDAEKEFGAEFSSFHDLLAQSDFVSIHTFLSSETRGMFNRDVLSRMKPSAILINASRGPVVDSDSLVWALQEKRIAGAALDVFDPEPIPRDHPLLSMENIVIVPHIASASIQTRRRMAEISVQNLVAGLRGERLPFCANPQVYAS